MKRLLLTVCLFMIIQSIYSLKFGDYLKAAPVTAKIVMPITMIPEMFSDGDSVIPGAIGLGLFTLPNSFLLYNIITENPVGIEFWRTATLYSDITVGSALAGSGIYLIARSAINDGSSWDDFIGSLYILMSAIVFGGVYLDTFPYSFEN